MLYLASAPEEQPVPIRSVSDALGIPYAFLAKVVQTLAQQGLVDSTRGVGGGIRLGRDATSITLRDIVKALGGEAVFTECILGLPGCGEQKPCPLHDQWAQLRHSLSRLFDQSTLADLAGRVQDDAFRIATLLKPS